MVSSANLKHFSFDLCNEISSKHPKNVALIKAINEIKIVYEGMHKSVVEAFVNRPNHVLNQRAEDTINNILPNTNNLPVLRSNAKSMTENAMVKTIKNVQKKSKKNINKILNPECEHVPSQSAEIMSNTRVLRSNVQSKEKNAVEVLVTNIQKKTKSIIKKPSNSEHNVRVLRSQARLNTK